MAVKRPQPGTMQFPANAQITEVTLSPTSLCHYITDDELEKLGQMQQEPVKDIFLASVGVFFGAVVPAASGVTRFGDTTHPMTLIDAISIALAFIFLGVICVSGYLWFVKTKTQENFVETVRQRPKVAVRLAHDIIA